MSTSNGNREAWLQAAVELMTPDFTAAGYTVPEVRVSCGFPSRSATSGKTLRIGECWSATAAGDRRAQIFISPLLSHSEMALATLVHEMVHAVVGTKAGHGAAFKRCATLMGLVGKMTSTSAGPVLRAKMAEWIRELGDYPHSTLSALQRAKQSTRLIKCECSECGYTVRTTAKWIGALGAPICPCNDTQMEVM